MARFFCDNCGTEVSRGSDRCPQCGRFFASVRCPQCSFTGEEGLFKKGCPRCGYCVPSKPDPSRIPAKQSKAPARLPLWVYILAGLGLAGSLTALFLTVH
ncbi:MAG: hypothetical protein LBD31_02550 [Treponema sp.]|nr:hypothetical protein [Treponema sp.]